ncbi:hypothetical protein DFQ29_010169, partial [Apophysomyces sp. BC1021]
FYGFYVRFHHRENRQLLSSARRNTMNILANRIARAPEPVKARHHATKSSHRYHRRKQFEGHERPEGPLIIAYGDAGFKSGMRSLGPLPVKVSLIEYLETYNCLNWLQIIKPSGSIALYATM